MTFHLPTLSQQRPHAELKTALLTQPRRPRRRRRHLYIDDGRQVGTSALLLQPAGSPEVLASRTGGLLLRTRLRGTVIWRLPKIRTSVSPCQSLLFTRLISSTSLATATSYSSVFTFGAASIVSVFSFHFRVATAQIE